MYFYKQVKFMDHEQDNTYFGGIAAYDEDKLLFVICGECGSVFEPEDVTIIKEYDNWVDISDEIMGDDKED